MKNYLIKYLVFFLPVLSLLACKKELNVYPTTSEVDGNIIFDAKSATTALNGVYYQFASAGVDFNNVPSTLWVDGIEAISSQLSGGLVNPNDNALANHTYVPTEPGAQTMWSYGYNIVNTANGFLENIAPVSTLSASSKAEMIAEAKFLRAYGNSLLLLFFGQYNDTTSPYGIILRTEPVTPGNINQARATVGQTYDALMADLDTAINYLPNLNTTIYYANVWTARLLEARVLINRGTAGDYAQVISLTNDIITNGPFSLEPNVQNIFWTNGLASNEVMLGIQPYPTQVQKYSEDIFYGQYYVSDSMAGFLSNDPRKTWYYSAELNYVNFPYSGPINGFIKYYPGSVTNIAPTPITENSYAFRLTEAYLLQAEALTLSGGSLAQAKTLLETVMSHAGITDFSAVNAANSAGKLQLLIVKEEMINFIGESGEDWYAVRRLPFATLQTLIPSLGIADLLILPIPQTEMTANSKLTGQQNPGY
jgi:hypothetical protein